MNAKELIKALGPLEGKHIYTSCLEGHQEMDCVEVRHLPPDERLIPNSANVILWNGKRDPRGFPHGIVVRATAVVEVIQEMGALRLVDKDGYQHAIRYRTTTASMEAQSQ